jgi:NAD+ kinase
VAIQAVGLIINRSKWETLHFAHQVIAWLTERDIDVWVDKQAAPWLGRDDIACDDAALAKMDLILTLGGDGTILAASRIAAPHGIPILGVHMGHFGFIAETHPEELFTDLEEVLEGRMHIEERMMVYGEVVRDGNILHRAYGLNDIVINKGAMARMLNLQTVFGGDVLATYPADGVIVATPTGSTAYALSAGGPLVEPTVQALLVVPICAHTLAARPLIIPADERISITVESDGGEVLFIADSGSVFHLADHDRIDIRRADHTTHIVTLHKTGFYRKIRKRLLWGERLNA